MARYEWQTTRGGRRYVRVDDPRQPAITVPVARGPVLRSFVGLPKPDLIAAAEERGLDTSGTKADLIERLSDG